MPVLTITTTVLIPFNLLPLVYCYLQLSYRCQQTHVLVQAAGVGLPKVVLVDPLSPVHIRNVVSRFTLENQLLSHYMSVKKCHYNKILLNLVRYTITKVIPSKEITYISAVSKAGLNATYIIQHTLDYLA
jgi:hypothetical protein